MRSKDGKSKFGGRFKDESDAAKRAHQICEELGIPSQNPLMVEMLTQQPTVTTSYLFFPIRLSVKCLTLVKTLK